LKGAGLPGRDLVILAVEAGTAPPQSE
jgi:hypothetical protein